jgi:hypothetical protein
MVFAPADSPGESGFFCAVEEWGFPDALQVGLKSCGEILFPGEDPLIPGGFGFCFHTRLDRRAGGTFGLFLGGLFPSEREVRWSSFKIIS